MLFGLYHPEEGEIRKDGKTVEINDPNDANALGIGMVHQHFKLVEIFSVLDNIILGVEPTNSAGVGGEKRGGQGTALNTHGGQDGDGDGQGAPAEAGQVVDGGDAGRGHGKNLVSGMGMSWIVIFILLRKMLLFKSG